MFRHVFRRPGRWRGGGEVSRKVFLLIPRRVWVDNGTFEMVKRWRWMVFITTQEYSWGILRSEVRR